MKKFEIGDKVVMKGVVVSKHKNTEHEYKVGVEWNIQTTPIKPIKQYYYQDGRYSSIDTEPTIFHENQERLVQVRDSEHDEWTKRVFIMGKNGKFFCWVYNEKTQKEIYIKPWNFMREIPEKRVITMQEIAEKFNIDVELIEIEK
jgi:hypothetical protein